MTEIIDECPLCGTDIAEDAASFWAEIGAPVSESKYVRFEGNFCSQDHLATYLARPVQEWDSVVEVNHGTSWGDRAIIAALLVVFPGVWIAGVAAVIGWIF